MTPTFARERPPISFLKPSLRWCCRAMLLEIWSTSSWMSPLNSPKWPNTSGIFGSSTVDRLAAVVGSAAEGCVKGCKRYIECVRDPLRRVQGYSNTLWGGAGE